MISGPLASVLNSATTWCDCFSSYPWFVSRTIIFSIFWIVMFYVSISLVCRRYFYLTSSFFLSFLFPLNSFNYQWYYITSSSCIFFLFATMKNTFVHILGRTQLILWFVEFFLFMHKIFSIPKFLIPVYCCFYCF